jgi:hypothetical protein
MDFNGNPYFTNVKDGVNGDFECFIKKSVFANMTFKTASGKIQMYFYYLNTRITTL